LEIGNEGQLWIQSGSNTNGGLAGQLSGSQQQTENYLAASTLVAKNFFAPDFNGHIVYSQPLDGVPVSGDIEVYASGMRNPFGLGMFFYLNFVLCELSLTRSKAYRVLLSLTAVLHSNGHLYGTDNGSNPGYVRFSKYMLSISSAASSFNDSLTSIYPSFF